MDGYSSLFIGALLLVIGLVRLAYLRIHSMPKRANKIPSPVLLVVAHPDDEAMFFAPILLNLKAANIPVDLLCLSNGNYDGVGLTRSKELDKSAKHFGVRHLKMVNLTELPDDPKCNWPLDLIAQIASSAVEEFHSQSLITFDQGGVSGHLNHCAIAKALEQARKRKLIPSLFCLQSLPLYRKYSSLVDVLCSVYSIDQLAFYVPTHSLSLAYSGMLCYPSQLTWFRWLYIFFSVYMYKNILVKKYSIF